MDYKEYVGKIVSNNSYLGPHTLIGVISNYSQTDDIVTVHWFGNNYFLDRVVKYRSTYFYSIEEWIQNIETIQKDINNGL